MPWALRLVVPAASALLAVLAAEVVLAVFFPVPYATEFNMYFEPDSYTGYRLKPYGKGFFQNGIPADANRYGQRSSEVSLPKPPGTLRLLVLGDSFTVGANVEEREAYPQVLEQLLRRRLGPRVEVVNCGVGGWQPFQYAEYYEHYGRPFGPDAVLVGFFVGNDTFDPSASVEQMPTAVLGRRVSRQEASRPLVGLKVLAYTHSHLARLILGKRYVTLDFRRRDGRDFTAQYLEIQRSRMSNHLRLDPGRRRDALNAVLQVTRIKRLADEASVPVFVVLIPDEIQINEDLQARLFAGGGGAYDLDMPQKMLKALFGEHGIPTIDLLPAFRRDPRCLYMNDTHWTPEGHALAAASIAEELAPRLEVPGDPGP